MTEALSDADKAPPRGSAPATGPVFVSDRSSGPDRHGIGVALEPLGRLVTHPQAEGPFTIGIFGGPGSGKTFALDCLLGRLAKPDGGETGALTRVVSVRVDAAQAGEEPVALIAARIYEALCASGPDGKSYGDLAQDCAQSGRDPIAIAREATDRLGETRRKLDAERLSLNELDGRRSRLTETVLYDTSGSRIESYARTNRASFDGRLRAFGFATNDPVATYKDLVRDVAEGGGLTGRIGAMFHSLWAFRGQTRLIVWAIVFFLLSFGLERLFEGRDIWLGWLRDTGGEKLGPSLGFVQSNVNIIRLAALAAFWAGVAALAFNIVRALRFTMPVFRGVRLLKNDLESRRRELDGLIAHQTRVADALSSEADALARRVEDAEKLMGSSPRSHQTLFAERPFDEAGASKLASAARNFVASVEREIQKPGQTAAPQRIFVALDNLDAVPADKAARLVEVAHSVLSGASFVSALVCDPDRLWPHDSERQTKYVQIPWRVAAAIASTDAQKAPLDAAPAGSEAERIDRLNEVFAATPRAAKRLANLYRLARTQTLERAGLALLLAVDIHGADEEREQLRSAIANSDVRFEPGRLDRAYGVASSPTANDLRTAGSVARIYVTRES